MIVLVIYYKYNTDYAYYFEIGMYIEENVWNCTEM